MPHFWQRIHWPRRPSTVGKVAVALLLLLAIAACARFALTVHALLDRRTAGPGWTYPSRLYADGLPFVPGRMLPDRYLIDHLELRGYRSVRGTPTRPGTYSTAPNTFTIFVRAFHDAADPDGHGGPERVLLTIARGRLVRVTRLGGMRGDDPPDATKPPRLEPFPIATFMDTLHVRRTWVPLARIPRVVRSAVVASEDRRFYRHSGLDLKSNARALVTNLRARGVKQGASTITQQLARALFLGRERTWSRKLSEIVLALGLEATLSKDQILEMYLNSVYWGQEESGGVAGIAEAARHYFAAPVESLGVSEAALLAGLIPAPNLYSPFRNPRVARSRRDAVLHDMVETGVLDRTTAERERERPLRVRRGAPPADRFPAFAGYVRDYLSTRLPAGMVEHRGLSMLSTLDPVWQARSEESLAEAVREVESWRGGSAPPLEGAFTALDPSSGAVRAMVGGREPVAGGFNRATQALRQPGSAIKPVVYAAALDPQRGGRRFTPATTVPDLKRSFDTPEGPWSPRNDESDYHDQVTLAKALAKSLNVATANLVEAIGPQAVTRYADRFGLHGFKAVPSVGLGTNEVTLLSLADAYSTFANGGVRCDPTPIRAVVEPRGNVLLDRQSGRTRVLPEPTAALMTGLLEDVVIFGVSYPLRNEYGFTRPVAGKTGTTNDYNDAWFMGYTPDAVAGVWIGYDTPKSLNAPAAQIALPVWAKIMTRLLEGFPASAFESDQALELKWIDPWTGGLSTAQCPSTMRVPFVPGTAPSRSCTRDHTADWQALDARRAADSTAALYGDSTAAPSDTVETPH